MYKVRLKIDAKGKFRYKQNIIPDKWNEIVIYYENHKDAVHIVKTFYREVLYTVEPINTIHNKDVSLLRDFEKYLNIIVDKLGTCFIKFLNIDIEIELVKCEKINYLGGYILESYDSPYFLIYYDFENNYDWDVYNTLDNYNEG